MTNVSQTQLSLLQLEFRIDPKALTLTCAQLLLLVCNSITEISTHTEYEVKKVQYTQLKAFNELQLQILSSNFLFHRFCQVHDADAAQLQFVHAQEQELDTK